MDRWIGYTVAVERDDEAGKYRRTFVVATIAESREVDEYIGRVEAEGALSDLEWWPTA